MAMIKNLCVAMAVVLLTSCAALAETDRTDKIVFLRLELDSTGVSLLKAGVVEGVLKQPRVPDTTRGILYRVYLDDGSEYMAGSLRDPRIRRFDYEDQDRPGPLKGKTVVLDRAPLLIRLPYRTGLSHMECFSRPPAKAGSPRGEPISLGRIDLSGLGEVQHD